MREILAKIGGGRMSRYIDRDLILAGIEAIKKSPWYNGDNGNYESLIRREAVDIVTELCIKQAPAADVAEVKHGEWKIEEYKNHLNVVCPNCNKEFYVYKQGQYRIDRSNYCPNCGARMDGVTNDGNVKRGARKE